MAKLLTSRRHGYNNYMELLEDFYKKGWTDGHPVVPPTSSLVHQFLDYVGLEPDIVIADIPDRNLRVTAEGVAINAVMAGCKLEYLPIIIAGVKAMAKPEFAFNHIACISSTMPHFIVSGPIVKELNINHGVWAWGAGDRATATIGRAFSLVLWNLTAQKPGGGAMAGLFGQPGRWSLFIAEDPDSPWTTLNVTEGGVSKDTSTITCMSLYAIFGQQSVHVAEPEIMLEMMMSLVFTQQVRPAVHLIQVPPALAKIFTQRGWTKERVRQYLLDNTSVSVAELKRRGQWEADYHRKQGKEFNVQAYMESMKVRPQDETTRAFVFKENAPELQNRAFRDPEAWATESTGRSGQRQRNDVILVVNGNDTGSQIVWRSPHSCNPVTLPIEQPKG